LTGGVGAAAAGIVNLGETAAPFALAGESLCAAAAQQIADQMGAAENAAAP